MVRCRASACLMVTFMALLSLPTSILVPSAVADATPDDAVPLIGVSFPMDTIVARITNTMSGQVEFIGNVTVGNVAGTDQRVTVEMDATCEWPVVVSPSTMVFVVNGSQEFHLTVVVPMRTHVGSSDAVVTARAVDDARIVTGSARCTVVVEQYYGLEAGAFPPVVHVGGSPATVRGVVNVQNLGNGNDTFLIEVLDPPGELTGFDLEPTGVADMGEWAEALYNLTLEFGTRLRGWSLLIMFRITSLGGQAENDTNHQDSILFEIQLQMPAVSDALEDAMPVCVGGGLVVLCAILVVLVHRRVRRHGGRAPVPTVAPSGADCGLKGEGSG